MSAPRTANVFAHQTSGLARNTVIVVEWLRLAGFEVTVCPIVPRSRGALPRALVHRWRPNRKRATLNLFMQDIVPEAFHWARTNVLMPNQEWFDPNDLKLLRAFDAVFAQSQHAVDIFNFRGPRVLLSGFTSIDRLDRTLQANRTRILHVAGSSPYKGSAVLARVWSRHPEWPSLTMVHADSILPLLGSKNIEQMVGRIDDGMVQQLQNESWLHILPTEAEAFGHSLAEAMSTESLLVTTDAPPMNEMVRSDRGVLIPFRTQIPLNLGHRFFVDEEALEHSLTEILERGPCAYRSEMRSARRWWEDNDSRVRNTFLEFFRSL